MSVRRATAEDLDAVARIEADNLGADAWSEGLVAQGLAGEVPTVVYFVAERDGAVVGYAAASLVDETAELQRIAVDRGSRRRGLATTLLTEAAAQAVAAGAERMLIEVRDDNAGALAFYEEAGFTELARRTRYYRDGATAVVLALPLTHPDVNVWTTS